MPLFAEVRSIVPNGQTVYVGGAFSRVATPIGSGLPFDLQTGLPRTRYPKYSGILRAIIPDGTGGWYVGGEFFMLGGVQRRNLAHILAGGEVDASFDPSPDGQVMALALSGGTLYVGGEFTSLAGSERRALGAINTGNGLATQWNPAPTNPLAPRVFALAISGGHVYVGGDFQTVGGQPRTNLAEVDMALGVPTSWNTNCNGFVLTLVPKDGILYAGGTFTSIGGQARHAAAALDLTTGLATAWDPLITLNGELFGAEVVAMAPWGGTVYLAGRFDAVHAELRACLAAVDATTGLPTPWVPRLDWNPLEADPYWQALPGVRGVVVAGGVVYIGGGFRAIDGKPRNGLAALDTVTAEPTDWNPDPNGPVGVLASDGATLYVAGLGGLTGVGGVHRRNLVALDASTGAVSTWSPDPDGQVNGLALSGTTLFVAGSFQTLAGAPRANIGAVDTATGAVTPWDPGANGDVRQIFLEGNTIYVTGGFTEIGGQPRPNLAAIDATSGLATAWNPARSRLDGEDFTELWVLPAAGRVYVGGEFDTIAGEPRPRLASFDALTGELTNWHPELTISSRWHYAFPLHVHNGVLYAGGYTSDGNFLAFDTTTGQRLDVPQFDNTPSSVAVIGSTIYVGGDFDQVDGEPRVSLAAFDENSTLLLPWAPAVDRSTIVSSMAPAGGGLWIQSPALTHYGNVPYVAGLAIFDDPGTAVSVIDPTQAGVIAGHITSKATDVDVYLKPAGGLWAPACHSSDGTFSIQPATGDGVYHLAAIASGDSNFTESPPAVDEPGDAMVTWNDIPNSAFTQQYPADGNAVFPMTSEEDVWIGLAGVTSPVSITDSRTVGDVSAAGIHPGHLIDECLNISGDLHGAVASLSWLIDRLAGDARSLPYAHVYQVETGSLVKTYSVLPRGNPIFVPGITSFSTWYAGEDVAAVAPAWLDMP